MAKSILLARTRGLYLSGLLRYLPILRFIASQRPATILDVGSGLHGIAPFVHASRVTVQDVSFPPNVRSHADFVVTGSMTNLPFSNNSYDLVVSCHAMEHIPDKLRQLALAEMVRVGKRWIVLSCPTGRDAEQADVELADWFRRRGEAIPGWLDDHLRFGLPDLLTLTESCDCKKQIIYNISIELNNAMARLESVRLFQILSGIGARVGPQFGTFLLNRIFSGERHYDAVLIMSKNNSS